MYTLLSTALLLASSSLLPSLAAAAPHDLNTRSCEPITPSLVIHLIENTPDTTYQDDKFIMSGDSDKGGTLDNTKTAMRFDIGPGKTGCRLAVKNPTLNPPNVLNTWGQIDTKVSLVEDIDASMTWNHPPAVKQDPRLPTQWNWLGDGTNLYAHDGACPETMSFLFEYNDWQTDGGWLVFQQRLSSNSALDGFTIIYDDCT